MLSTPPASTRSASPARTARAAMPTASRPDPQSRLTVPPGTETGRPGQQRGHPGDVAVVLAGLVGAAEQHVVQLGPVHRRQPAAELAEHVGGEVVRPHRRQRAAVPAERGAHPGDQERLIGGASCHDAPAIASRSRNFWILPLAVRGSSGSTSQALRPVLPGHPLLAEELLHLVEGELRDPRLEHDAGAGPFLQPRVRHADDRDAAICGFS